MSQDVLLQGKCKWAKLFKPESYQNGPPKYSIQLYLDSANKAVFEGLKLKNHIKADEQGEYVQLRRDHNPKIWDGKIIKGAEGGPPKVIDADGNPWDTSVLVGNGSVVSVILNVYDSKMGRGSRLSRVRVDTLVPYTPSSDVNSEAMPF